VRGWGVGSGDTYRSAFMVEGSSGMMMVMLLKCSEIQGIKVW
jgi:hypothetical protein